jgi:hypothetical protein
MVKIFHYRFFSLRNFFLLCSLSETKKKLVQPSERGDLVVVANFFPSDWKELIKEKEVCSSRKAFYGPRHVC